jgi:hypothetical protein
MCTGITINVSPADRVRLDAVVADRNSPQKHVWRARIVLRSADGCGTHEIMRENRKSPDAQEVRALLVGRKLLQSRLRDVELSIRGILRGFGLKVGEVSKAKFAVRIRELVAGHAMLGTVTGAMLVAREGLLAEFMRLHRQMLAIVRADAVCRRLMTAPGVGALVAITFRTAVADPGRFGSSKAVGAHFGLTPKRYQSGEMDVIGGISKCGLHRPKPTHAQQLRDATGVLAVGLDRHRRQRRLHMPGFQQHRLEACLAQASVQPLRQRTGLQPDPRHLQAKLAKPANQRLRLTRHLRLAHDPAGGIDHAHTAVFQRDVDPSIVLHGCPSMMPGADPFGPRFTHHHSEGQPPFRLLPGGRPITASSSHGSRQPARPLLRSIDGRQPT